MKTAFRLCVAGVLALSSQAFAETCEQKITALTFQCMGQNTNGTVAAAASCRKMAERQANCASADGQTTAPTDLSGIDPGFRELSPAAESTVSKAGIVLDVASTEAKCIAAFKRSAGLISTARAFEQFEEKYLGPFGNLITAIKIGNLVKTGQGVQAAQETATATLDAVMCRSGGNVCVSWMVGRRFGELLNDGPKIFGISDRSLNDWWTDEISDFVNSGPTEADYRRFEADARRKIAAAKAAASAQKDCSK